MAEPAAETAVTRIGLVGLGLIGGSIALRLRERAPHILVAGLDRPDRLAAARQLGVVHESAGTLADLSGVDLIVLAVPPGAMLDIVPQLAHLPATTVVTDVASTKRQIVAAARRAGLAAFVGGHPMAGSERAGIEHARADLFDRRPWLLVEGTGGRAAGDTVEQFVRIMGAEPRWIDADGHDRCVAYVSHLPQLVAVALMNAAADGVGHDALRLAGPAFRDMTRLASSPPELWQSIVPSNADYVAEAIGRFLQNLPVGRDLSEDGWVREAFDRAGGARARWRGDDSSGG